jgi:hypothetical protein
MCGVISAVDYFSSDEFVSAVSEVEACSHESMDANEIS